MRLTLPVFTLAAGMLACLFPSQARAQVTLAAVAPDLPAGHRTVLTVDGRPLTGDLVRASADGVVLWRYDTGRADEIPAARVSAITYDDTLLNGAMLGAVVGAVPGFIAGLGVQQYCRNESSSSCDSVPFSVAGVTGLVGLGIGSAIDGVIRTTVRVAPAPGATTRTASVSLRPDRRRPTALVSIAF